MRHGCVGNDCHSKSENFQCHSCQRNSVPGPGMCPFHQTDLPSTNGIADVQPTCNIQTTASSLNLPPLRSIDPLRQFASHPSQGPELSGQGPALGLPPFARSRQHLDGAHQYYGVSPGCHVRSYRDSGAPVAQTNLLPYPSQVPIATPQSHRLMSAGRNKREIKRRTKTGCRTCRKRRIKVRHLHDVECSL